LQRLLKKPRPLFRPVQRQRLTLEALEDRRVLSFLPPVTFPAGINPRAVTVADFNNDGKPDLAVVNSGSFSTSQSSVSVLLGNGNGSFQPAVTTNIQNSGPGQGNALSLAVADFNRDGLPDVAVNTSGTPANPAVEVLLGKGDGSFQPNHQILPVGLNPVSVAVGDFDRNGAPDLVTANISSGSLSLLLNNGDGTFRPHIDLAVGSSPRAVAVGDFNGDGLPDVVTAQQLSNTVSVLLGHGNGTFAQPMVFAASSGLDFAPSSLAVGDLNGDGRADLVINSIGGEDSVVSQLGVLLGHGDGTFGAPIFNSPQGANDGDVALGDFNGDGHIDAAVGGEAALPDGLSVFNGNGDGTFQPFLLQRFSTGGTNPFGVAAADLNGDGLVDLVAANSSDSATSPGSVGVLLNTAGPVAAAPTTTTLSTSIATAVFGQTETLTATVSSRAGTPIGSVIFRDGDTVLGLEPLDATGQASVPVSLGIGTHTLTATFSGSIGFADSTSAATTVTVNPAKTTLALASSVNPAVTGQAVTFTATVAAVAPGATTPTGTVTFQDGNVVLGTALVGAGGKATITTSFAAAGSHVITAVYSGAANFGASTQIFTEQVNAAAARKATTTSLLASANPATVRQGVTFTATVQDPTRTGTPTGSVTFFVGNTAVARVTLDASGQARIRLIFTGTGRFTIRAVYSGDSSFDVSSQSLTEQVNR
jgi:hypothetical protein